MFNTEENIEVPENIDDYVKRGIALGIKKKKANKRKLAVNAVVICVLTIFTVSVRISPAFAAYMVKVPGLEYLVKLINYDKGLQSAIENNFVQNINASVTNEGIKVTIKDVIIDNSKAIIFYSIENQRDDKYVSLDEIKITDEKGEILKIGITWGDSRPDEKSISRKVENKFELDFNEETVLPDKLYIDICLRERNTYDDVREKENVLPANWHYEIPVDKEKIKSMERNYMVNQKVEVEGQIILFNKVTITPTRIAVEVEYDKNNTKKIMRFDSLELVDEKGEKWATITNGVSAAKKDEYHETLYFQSNYFNDPREIYIQGYSVRALDKEKLTVEVDLKNSRLLNVPDNKLTLESIANNNGLTTFNFNLEVDENLDKNYAYNVFSHGVDAVKDADGNTYEYERSGVSTDGTNMQNIYLVIKTDDKLKGPLSFKIEDYPERIKGSFKVKIN
jgi:hypothetical protein